MSLRAKAGLKTFTEEYNREQAQVEAERLLPVTQAAQRIATLEQEIADTEKQIIRDGIFITPSKYLAQHCTPYTKTLNAEAVTVATGNAVNGLKLYLDSLGREITNAGLAKVGRVIEVNGSAVDSTEADNLITIWKYLTENDCLSAADYKVLREIKPAAPTPTPAEDEIDIDEKLIACDMRKPEDRAKSRKLVADYEAIQARPLWREWVDWMRQNYEIPMTADQQSAVAQFLYERGQGINVKTLNIARRWLGCLSPDEELAKEIEQHAGSVAGYAIRKDIAQRIRRVTQ
jgi:hypothetical protein